VRVSRLVVVVLAMSCLAAALLGGSAARAEPHAIVLDRTFTCAISPRGGLYIIDARAHSGTRLQGKWAKLAYAGLRSGNFGLATGNMLAWVTSGKPTAATTVEQDFEAFDVNVFGTVGVRRDACRAAAAPIPLTPAGLRGGPAGALGVEYECPASRQVIVRFRTVLAATGRLKQGDDFLTAHVPVLEAKLAVRTVAGKPLAYGEVIASGKARLLTARGCTAQ
jgi:hypothetical protein